jgi:hypothetical protein
MPQGAGLAELIEDYNFKKALKVLDDLKKRNKDR